MHLTASRPPRLDATALAELSALGPDVLVELARLLGITTPERLGRLRRAVARQLTDAILREARGLKGSALAVGALQMAAACAAIEEDVRGGRFGDAVAHLTSLEPEAGDVQHALEEML